MTRTPPAFLRRARRPRATAMPPVVLAFFVLTAGMLCFLVGAGCDDPAGRAEQADRPTRLVSLSPAATDLLIGLGEADRLVGVSTYDTDPLVGDLPRMGDYLNVDWEQIAASSPTHLIIQLSPERTPPGLTSRAQELGIELVHLQIDDLADIREALRTLAGILDESGESAVASFDARLDAVRQQAAGREPVPALVAFSTDAKFVAGQENFVDELLRIAGGENVIEKTGYPTIDTERLLSLDPERVILILPDATPGQLAEAQHFFSTLPPDSGLGWEDVTIVNDPALMLPGWHAPELAATMAEALASPTISTTQPPASLSTQPTTAPAEVGE